METILNKYGVNQLGIYVEDLEKAAKYYADMFGAGPFFDLGTPTFQELKFRGEPSDLRIHVASGQFNNMQIELIEVLNDVPNVYKEFGHYGLHHISVWTDDVDKAKDELCAAGGTVAMEQLSGGGMHVYYIDCREQLGMYVEIHNPIEQFWGAIKSKAADWDGTRVLRPVKELMG